MDGRAQARWAAGTLAIVAIALAVDSLRRPHDGFDGQRAPQRVIRRQLDAFNRDDYRAAYRFASSGMREQFPLRAFRRMVEDGYPQIAHSQQASLGPSLGKGGAVVVPVKLTGKDGVLMHYLYFMQHEEGGWHVAGVEGDHRSGTGPAPPARSHRSAPRSLPPRSTRP